MEELFTLAHGFKVFHLLLASFIAVGLRWSWPSLWHMGEQSRTPSGRQNMKSIQGTSDKLCLSKACLQWLTSLQWGHPSWWFLPSFNTWGTFPTQTITQTITFPYPLKHIRRLSGQFCRVSERMKVKNHEKALMEVATVNKVYAVIKTILNSHYLSASAGLRGEHKELSFENTCLFRLQSNQGQGQDTGFSLKTKYDSKISAYWMVENRQVLRARTGSWKIYPSSLHLQIHSPRVGGACAWKASTPEALSDSCCCHLLASSAGKWQGSENTNPLVCRRHSHFPWKLLEKRKTKAHSTRQKPD